MQKILPSFVAAVLFFLEVSCSPITEHSTYAVKDSHIVPPGWLRISDAPADHVITLKIGLKQGKFEELENHLFEVSDPSHHRYGKYLTQGEVNELVKPEGSTLDAVHKWLGEHGISTDVLSYNGPMDWITVNLPVPTIERLLDTKYSVYENERDGDKLIRTNAWSLPLGLHEHIVTIQPTNSFWRPMAKRVGRAPVQVQAHAAIGAAKNSYEKAVLTKGKTVKDVCNTDLVTPLCLRTLYGTVDYKVKAAGKNKVALNDFLGEINLRSDAKIYLEKFRPDAIKGASAFNQISIAGGTLQQTPFNAIQLKNGTGIEGNLDAQTILGISYPTPMTAYSTGGLDPTFKPDAFTTYNEDEPYLVWLEYILAQYDIPQVISSSYADDEQTISKSYATHVCNLFAQLGARGVTVLFASGDYGVGGTGYCYSNDGKNTTTFVPNFPPTCPYVTVVGGTHKFEPEVAAYDPAFSTPFASGGGFSRYFAQPKYQKYAVENYLKKTVGKQYKGLYNPAGRAYPDIAAQSVNFSTVWNGSVIPIDGTSAATPTAAGVLTLVNDALIAAGRSPLGFMNPWLYAGGYKAFNDILSGSALGCGVTGFEAAKGWDAVTGWGTPQFGKIVEALDCEWK